MSLRPALLRLGLCLLVPLGPGVVSAQPAVKSRARLGLPFPPVDARLESMGVSDRGVVETVCGPIDDSQEVELYNGTLGPSQDFVAREEPSTVQLQWRQDLADLLTQTGDSPGNVSGIRWCTGTLIADDLLITAAHCFRMQQNPSGWLTPKRGGTPVPPAEIATMMQANFNYQRSAETFQIRTPDVYPILELVEFGDERQFVQGETLDYAIVRVGVGKDGELPSARYPIEDFDSSRIALDQATQLSLIQHPQGSPKRIEAGEEIYEPRDVLIRYADLDTLGGSSGSGILDQRGVLIGVHTNGGCSLFSGFNFGVTLNAIRQVSDIIN